MVIGVAFWEIIYLNEVDLSDEHTRTDIATARRQLLVGLKSFR
jgi:hypothetical protein